MPVIVSTCSGVYGRDRRGELVKIGAVRIDEWTIDPAVVDQQIADAIDERDVRARTRRQVQIGAGRDGQRAPRVDDDDLGLLRAGLCGENAHPEHRALLSCIMTEQDNAFGFFEIVETPRWAVGAEALHQRLADVAVHKRVLASMFEIPMPPRAIFPIA